MMLSDTCCFIESGGRSPHFAHAPEHMDAERVNDSGRVYGKRRCELGSVARIRVIPYGQRVDLITDKMDLVLLAEFHELDDEFLAIASSLPNVLVRLDLSIKIEGLPRGLCGVQRTTALIVTPSLLERSSTSSYFSIVSRLRGSMGPKGTPTVLTLELK